MLATHHLVTEFLKQRMFDHHHLSAPCPGLAGLEMGPKCEVRLILLLYNITLIHIE